MKNVEIKLSYCILTLSIYIIGIIMGLSPLYSLCCLICITAIVIGMQNIYENFSIVFFLITFFVFLLSSEFVQEVFGMEVTREVTAEAKVHTARTLLLGLIFLLVGYSIKSRSTVSYNVIKRNDSYCLKVRQVAKILFYCTYVLYFAEVVNEVRFVSVSTYNLYYLEYSSSMPVILEKLGDMSPIALAVYLATFPNKKQCKIPFFLYLLYAFMTFLVGKRYLAVASVLFVITYCIIRNKTDKQEGIIWISKKIIALGIAIVPFACIGLYTYAYIRSGIQLDSTKSLFESFLSFFLSIGSSNRIIEYGYMYKDAIPEGHCYTFGGIIDYVRSSSVWEYFTGYKVTPGSTVEYALEGNAFSYIIAYLDIPSRYLKGSGLGSCYLAELYQDMGYVGVAFGSFVYGVMLKRFFRLRNNKIWHNALVFYLYTFLLRTPRDSFDFFIKQVVNVKFIVFFGCIFLFARMLCKQTYYLKNEYSVKKEHMVVEEE